jgi:hypothetical protein
MILIRLVCPEIYPFLHSGITILTGSLKHKHLSGEDCVAVLPTGYGKPELSILYFPVRGSGDLIRQLKGHEKMTCKPYLSDPDDMRIESGV